MSSNIETENTQIIYLEKYKLAYLAVPKVANSSIKTCFAANLGLTGDENRKGGLAYLFNHPEEAKRLKEQGVLITKSKLTELKRKDPKLTVIGMYRDPIERVHSFYSSCQVSDFLMKKLSDFYGANVFYQGQEFEDFLAQVVNIPDLISNRHFQSQYLFFQFQGKSMVDELYYFDEMNETLIPRLAELGLDVSGFRNVNQGKKDKKFKTDSLPSELLADARERFDRDYALRN